MKVRFKVEHDETEMSKNEFFAKIDRAAKDIKDGKGIKYTPELKKELFRSIL